MRKLIAAAALVATSLGGVALAPHAGASTDRAASAASAGGADHAAPARAACGADGSFRNLEVVGLTGQRLICFRAARPDRTRDIGRIQGLQGDTRLVGIDFRPATGDLYGLGDQGGVYVVDVQTAQASLAVRAGVALRGTSFGVDFNPAADRLRVVSDAGQNLRINVTDGTTNTDADLAYTPGTPATGITGAAYTNNDAATDTGTTLFDVDSGLDQVAIQSPPNNGSLVPTGKLTVATDPDLSADIYSKVRNGTTVANQAYAALSLNGRSSLYGLDLLTGRAYSLGRISVRGVVVGIAIPLDQG